MLLTNAVYNKNTSDDEFLTVAVFDSALEEMRSSITKRIDEDLSVFMKRFVGKCIGILKGKSYMV